MNFGFGVGDILTISELAVKVYTAYKDGPENHRHISEEVEALQILIDGAEQYFTSTIMSSHVRDKGQKALKGCQSVLEDLYSLIEKYKSPASTSIFKRVKLGTEDLTKLRARLTTNAVLLDSFLNRCDIFTSLYGILC